MMRKIIGIACGGIVLVGIGVWLGRSSLTPSHDAAAPTAQSDRPVRMTAPAAHARVQTRPSVPSHAVAPSPGLEIDLRDPDPRVRREAVAEIAASDAPDPKILLAASRDRDLGVGVAATEGLGKLYRDGQLPASELVARISDHGLDDKVRVTAINALGLVDSPDSAAALVDLLAHGDLIDRRSAAILLVHQDAATAIPALIGALRDSDPLARSNAHDSLRTFARGRDFGDDTGAWSSWWQARR
jgi:hypothetical protein